MKPASPKIVEVNREALHDLMQRAEAGAIGPADCSIIRTIIAAYLYVVQLLELKRITLARLRQLIFGEKSEKTRQVVDRPSPPSADNGTGDVPPEAPAPSPATPAKRSKPRKPGRGRNGAEDYPGARRVKVPHQSLKAGELCIDCGKGTLYNVSPAGILIRFVGQPPLAATIYELEKLRCGTCGKLFTAEAPPEAGAEKYDPSACTMIAMMKYGTGVPFHRLDTLQDNVGIPFPSSTQWVVVSAAVPDLAPVYEELIRQAAQGEVLYNDDTTMKILGLADKQAASPAGDEPSTTNGSADSGSTRKGIFTSGVVATKDSRRIALFFTGKRHAGENLEEILRRRAADLPPPIQMCDALSRNLPKELATVVANCMAHARRQFVDIHDSFPSECRYVLEALEVVYGNDALARTKVMSAEERLAFHQAESGPVMERLRLWLKQQVDERLVEPNSALGAAIAYLRKHWEKLTLFLRKAGAPLDNNIVERALKKVILHRKNALFYKTERGAYVGDVYMSLIYTCELAGVNPFDYLTQLQLHAKEVAANPAQWLPWNYQETLAAR
jgi:hypothetical protein